MAGPPGSCAYRGMLGTEIAARLVLCGLLLVVFFLLFFFNLLQIPPETTLQEKSAYQAKSWAIEPQTAAAGLQHLELLNPQPWQSLAKSPPPFPQGPTLLPSVAVAATDSTPLPPTAQKPANKGAAEAPGACRYVAVGTKVAALTFDDGPYEDLTPQYLAILAAKEVKATFFLVGNRAKRYPELVRLIASQGHEVAVHSWRHADMAAWDQEAVTVDLAAAADLLRARMGVSPRLFRAPYGHWTPNVLRGASAAGLEPVAWSIDPRDWCEPAPQTLVARVLANLHPGAIILLHEGHLNTANALPELLAALEDQGYKLVTVSELLEQGRAVRASSHPGTAGAAR